MTHCSSRPLISSSEPQCGTRLFLMAPLSRKNPSLPQNRVKKTRKRNTENSRLLEEWERAEESYCEQQCTQIIRNLTQVKASASGSVPVEIEEDATDIFTHQESIFECNNDTSTTDTESESESVDSQLTHSSTGEVVTRITSDINRSRRIREDFQWQQVIAPMFKTFMLCADRTSEWSRQESWNCDFKAECRCSQAKRRTRDVELFDILSKIPTSYLVESLLKIHFLFLIISMILCSSLTLPRPTSHESSVLSVSA